MAGQSGVHGPAIAKAQGMTKHSAVALFLIILIFHALPRLSGCFFHVLKMIPTDKYIHGRHDCRIPCKPVPGTAEGRILLQSRGGCGSALAVEPRCPEIRTAYSIAIIPYTVFKGGPVKLSTVARCCESIILLQK
jgi:hypothetical protein